MSAGHINHTSQEQTIAIMQAQTIARQTADKARGLCNHAWGQAYLTDLYRNNTACREAALAEYQKHF